MPQIQTKHSFFLLILCPGDTPWAQNPLERSLRSLGDVICLDEDLGKRKVKKSRRFEMLCTVVLDALPKVCLCYVAIQLHNHAIKYTT